MGDYFVEDGVHGVEARPEADFARAGHFVGDTGVLIFCFNDAVVLGVKVELDCLCGC